MLNIVDFYDILSEVTYSSPFSRIEINSMEKLRYSSHGDDLLNVLFFQESLLGDLKFLISLNLLATSLTSYNAASTDTATKTLKD